jgi:hypothetical protein
MVLCFLCLGFIQCVEFEVTRLLHIDVVNVCGDGILEMLEHSTIFCLDIATNGFIWG